MTEQESKNMMGDREFIRAIMRAADIRAQEVNNPFWKRAYLRLADAADCIDAIIARSQEHD